MASNKKLSGYGFAPLVDESFASGGSDVTDSVDTVIGAAELLGAWLSLRRMLFAQASEPSALQPSFAREISRQKVASKVATDVRVNPWGVTDVSQGALQRRKSSVERN